jgi:hypothetical protein
VRVQLVTHLDNVRSQKVAERSGFRREGVLRAWEPVKDEQPDVVMWSRLVDDPTPEPAPTERPGRDRASGAGGLRDPAGQASPGARPKKCR